MKTKRMTISEGVEYDLSQYPNFHKSGSISGMKRLCYEKNALLVRCGNYIYNVPLNVYNAAH